MNNQRPVNIIMIEDDEGHARLIEKNIRRAGISNDTQPFHRWRERDRLSVRTSPMARCNNGPALILLDLNLPDMSGTDILERIKSDPELQRRPRSWS